LQPAFTKRNEAIMATATAPRTTFDYAAAWEELARPAYEALPQNVRDLLAQVATEAARLGQLPDLTMPWPNDPQLGAKGNPDSDLRERFAAVPADVLAYAARVIHSVGHWYPSHGRLNLPGRAHGAHWKFSHYADQDLRRRLIEATSADLIRNGGPFAVHEGAIRLCYSTRDMWTWAEVAPATVNGLTLARALAREIPDRRVVKNTGRAREEHEMAVSGWFADLRTRDLGFYQPWVPWLALDAYNRPEQEIRLRELAAITPDERAATRARQRAEIVARYDTALRKVERQRTAALWVHGAGLDSDNAILYDHENGGAGLLCFGWREAVTATVRDQILAVISECPFAYRIICLDGRTLEGGIG
jgi:hypothetical protein